MTFNENWSRVSGEVRTEDYRTWRTRRGFGAVCDLDQIEYRANDGTPLLLIELCVADRQSDKHPGGVRPGQAPSPRFFEQIEKKVDTERPQGRVTRSLAETLGIPLVLVVYISGELNAGVWVKRIGSSIGWRAMSLSEFENRLRQIYGRSR